jgi:hypothetical protein
VSAPSQTVSALRSLLAAAFRKGGGGRAAACPPRSGPIDDALGGGLPAGRLTELVSAVPSSGGQTVLAGCSRPPGPRGSGWRSSTGRTASRPGPCRRTCSPPRVGALPRPEQAFAVADILVRDGNYAAVVLDLRGCAERVLRRTPASIWYRLQRAAEGGSVAVLVQTASLSCPPSRGASSSTPRCPWPTPAAARGRGRPARRADRAQPRARGVEEPCRLNYAVLIVPDFALHALRRSDPSLCGRAVAWSQARGAMPGSPRLRRRRGASPRARGDARHVPVPRDHPEAARARAGGRGPPAPARRGVHARPARRVDAGRVLHDRPAGRGPGPHRGAHAAARRRAGGAGLPARIGAGATPLLASYAARRAEPVLIVRDPAGFLAPLPLAFADPSPEQEAILRGWGIGPSGAHGAAEGRGRPAAGRGGRAPLGARRGRGDPGPAPGGAGASFAAEWSYEPPVESIEPLFFKLRRFAERVALELRGAGFVAEKLSLTLLLEDGTDHRREFRLPEPGADVEGWLRILNAHLRTVRTDARVAGVRLVAAPGAPVAEAGGPVRHGPAGPGLVLGEPGARSGRSSATTGSARRCRRTPTGRTRLSWRGPPRPCPPGRADGAPPVRTDAAQVPPALAGARRCEAGGPPGWRAGGWRAGARRARPLALRSGDWWKPQAWAVETWQVEMAGGGVYQLACTDGRLERRGDAGLGAGPGADRCRTSNSMRAARSPSCAAARCRRALVAEAGRLGMPALALCDRDGVYGAVRLHMAGKEAGVRALVGASSRWRTAVVVPVLVATRRATGGCAAC